jgi:CheY-like chemotaxis protein
MSDDFISMKILIVSEATPERELLRRASAEAPIPVDVSELDAPGDPVAMGELLARQNFDVVFFDSRIAKPARQELLNVIRAAPSRPLAVLIAPAMLKTREVFTDGLEVDSALAKPIDLQETRDLIASAPGYPSVCLSLTIRRRCAQSYEKCCRPAGASLRLKRREMDRRRSSLRKSSASTSCFWTVRCQASTVSPRSTSSRARIRT